MSVLKSLFSGALSLDLTSVLIFLSVLLVTYYVYKCLGGPNLPPGPPRLPLVGSAPFFDMTLPFWRATKLLQEKYHSDIISLDLYGRLIILLQTQEVAKEAFQKRDDMVDRSPRNFFKTMEPEYKGILSSSGHVWKEQRRFALFMLRDFGMGKIAAEQSIQDECLELGKRMEELSKNPDGFDPLPVIEPAVSNIICALAFGRRFDYDDKDFNAALNGLNFLVAGFSGGYSHLALSPGLSWLLPYVFSTQHKEMTYHYNRWGDFIRSIIQEHREKFDGSVNDVIEGFFVEQEKRISDKDSTFTETQLRHVIQDLFLAGSETTTTTLRWAILFYLSQPEIAERVDEELVQNIGERVPCMGDKKNTPYTEAFLMEVQRYNTIVPNAVGHSTPVPLQFRGYTIPANCFILSNLTAIHRDEKVFKDPDTFNVERFFQDGKVVNADKLNQFGIGRRVCAGEALARMEVYLFFAYIILHYKITHIGKSIDLKGRDGAIYGPKGYKIRVAKRVSDCSDQHEMQ